MKVLIDMNLSPRWVPFLVNAGHPTQHWSSIGPAGAPDEEIMAFARKNECVVLTHDLDFSAMLMKSRDAGPSVLQVRSDDLDPKVIGPAVLEALEEFRSNSEAHLLVTVHPKRKRVRVLPFP